MLETADQYSSEGSMTPAVKSEFRGWRFFLTWIGILAGIILFVYMYTDISAYSIYDIYGSAEEDLKSADFIILNILSIIVLGGMIGAAIGLAQWLGLNRKIKDWILASGIGAGAALLLHWAFSYMKYLIAINSKGLDGARQALNEVGIQAKIEETLSTWFPKASFETISLFKEAISGPLFIGTILGLGIGLLQWWILRRYVQRAGWWILANVLGWALGCVAAYFLIYSAPKWIPDPIANSSWQALILFVILGAIGVGLFLGAITGGTMIWLWQKPQPPEEQLPIFAQLYPTPTPNLPDPTIAPPPPTE